METTETIIQAMVREIRDGAAAAAQDLSKGVVPIVLVLAIIGPAYWLGTKVEGVRREQEAAATSMQKMSDKLDTLTPLVNDVANLGARMEAHTRALELAERDRKLLETRIKNLEIETEVRKRAGRD